MKTYRFPLERVLAIRRLEEESARAAHQVAEHALEEIEEALHTIGEERTRRQGRLSSLRLERPLSLASLHLLEDELDWIARRERTLAAERERAAQEAARKLDDLLEAHRRQEGLTRLRQRRATQWVKQVERRTELLMDDLVGRRRTSLEMER
ncbi:MAG: hypothetical protein H6834_05030 [Planctomycetes bacterium]|nr:hypothetical protein [Planctomycetota bacterium]